MMNLSFQTLKVKVSNNNLIILTNTCGQENNALSTGLLIGCGKKREILRHFQGKLRGKKGPLCGKLCDFLTLFY